MTSETTMAGKQYFVSIPFYGHKVYKHAGLCPSDAHADFYVPYFMRYGHGQREGDGPFVVVLLDSRPGDRIFRDSTGEWVEFTEAYASSTNRTATQFARAR